MRKKDLIESMIEELEEDLFEMETTEKRISILKLVGCVFRGDIKMDQVDAGTQFDVLSELGIWIEDLEIDLELTGDIK